MSVNSGQAELLPCISYDTVFKVALSTRFLLYHIVECACIAAVLLRGHSSSGCVGA